MRSPRPGPKSLVLAATSTVVFLLSACGGPDASPADAEGSDGAVRDSMALADGATSDAAAADGATDDSGTVDGSTPTDAGPFTLPPAPSGPIFLFYGAYRLPDGSGIDWPNTLPLISDLTGAETVLVMQGVDQFTPWVDGGGKLAYHFTRVPRNAADTNAVEAQLDRDDDQTLAAAYVRNRLSRGYEYLAIDELSANATEWTNGGRYAVRFVRLLERLAAEGLDRRIILYINAYNMLDTFDRYSDVLAACRDHCRILANEVYLTDNAVRVGTAPVAGKCVHDRSCISTLAYQIARAAPGAVRRMITVIAVAERWHDYRDTALCAPGDGALYLQYAYLHSNSLVCRQPGVGGYSLTRNTVASYIARQSDCLERLDGWTDWATSTRARCDGP
jgi:hypothetical protein